MTSRSDASMALVRRTDDEMVSLAERLAKSTLLPKSMQGKMPDVLMTIMAGQEMGLAPMASLRAFHVIDGKPIMSSDGMVAIVIGSGKAVYFECVAESDTSITYETLRAGGKHPQRTTWTLEMAKRASLHQKDNWRGYPRQMLASRAKSELARKVYPDVLMGCYSDDEMPIERRRPEVQDAEFVDRPTNDVADSLDAIEAAETLEDLEALIPMLKGLSGSALKDGRKRYAERKAKLTEELARTPYADAITANPATGTMCSVCDQPQVESPSGVTCKFGHGGAPAKDIIP